MRIHLIFMWIRTMLRIRIQIRIRMFLGLPDPDPLVRGMDPDPSDPFIIKQKQKTFFEFFLFGLLKVSDENRRIRIRISQRHGSADPEFRIHTKMSRIRNTVRLAFDVDPD